MHCTPIWSPVCHFCVIVCPLFIRLALHVSCFSQQQQQQQQQQQEEVLLRGYPTTIPRSLHLSEEALTAMGLPVRPLDLLQVRGLVLALAEAVAAGDRVRGRY